jgi:hypothetical protein
MLYPTMKYAFFNCQVLEIVTDVFASRENKIDLVRWIPRLELSPGLEVLTATTDLQHAIFMTLLNGKLALAPLDTIPVHNVLDVATGG